MNTKNNLTTEYNSEYTKLKTEYQKFIGDKGPYRYFVSVTLSRDYNEQQLYDRINFLLKVLSRNIFNSKKNHILLEGFCFIESSGKAARCGKHFHIIIKENIKLDYKKPFVDTFLDSVDRVKVMINGDYIQVNEFSRKCISIEYVTDQKPLIGYLTDEFYKDKNGNFIKPIDKYGLVV